MKAPRVEKRLLTGFNNFLKKFLDYATRRFNASSAGRRKPEGAGPSLDAANAISRSNWKSDQNKRALFGTTLALIAVGGFAWNLDCSQKLNRTFEL